MQARYKQLFPGFTAMNYVSEIITIFYNYFLLIYFLANMAFVPSLSPHVTMDDYLLTRRRQVRTFKLCILLVYKLKVSH